MIHLSKKKFKKILPIEKSFVLLQKIIIEMKKTSKNPNGAGRKKKYENKALINFNIEYEDKMKLKSKFSGKLNDMFIVWVKSLIN